MKGSIVWLILVLFFRVEISCGQAVCSVSGTYRLVVMEHMSLEAAKIAAVQRAKIQALADRFGTNISQNTSTIIKNHNEKNNISILSLASSDVNGEWISDTKEPRIEVDTQDNTFVVTAWVEGKARELTSAGIDVVAKVLRNGTEDKFEDDEFNSGDDLFLCFESPSDGYLAVYLVDDSQQAYCLLPYQRNTTGRTMIKGGKRYLFFSQKHSPTKEEIVDEYGLICEKTEEYNRIYILFSPNEFSKANDAESSGEMLPRVLPLENFQKWLTKSRIKDSAMQVVTKIIAIKNNSH
ncbi:MAG: DUF4384 domain-containing protein [Mucinivorans sp.]